MKKKDFIFESRGSMVNDLDKAIENGYKVVITYLNEDSGNIVTRSVYLFSRGLTSTGKMCYRAFQYDPNGPNGFYDTKKKHGWRLFDVEKIKDFQINRRASKLWIKGEIPEWLSRLNTENDKMFKQTFKSMDIELFVDKHGRSNSSLHKRRDSLASKKFGPEKNQDDQGQKTIFDEPQFQPTEDPVKKKRKYTKPIKKDTSTQYSLDFDNEDPTPENNTIKKQDLINRKNNTSENPQDTETDEMNLVQNSEDEEVKDIDDVKECVITKKDLLNGRKIKFS